MLLYVAATSVLSISKVFSPSSESFWLIRNWALPLHPEAKSKSSSELAVMTMLRVLNVPPQIS